MHIHLIVFLACFIRYWVFWITIYLSPLYL